MLTETNDKPIRIVNVEAIRLAKRRALREGRSAANAASQTIIEALSRSDSIAQSRENQEKLDANLGILTTSKQTEIEAAQEEGGSDNG